MSTLRRVLICKGFSHFSGFLNHFILAMVWHPARLLKEGGCVDLSMDTLHLNYPLVLFGSEVCLYSPSFSSFA